MDKIEDEPEVAEELGIIKFTYVWDSSKCNIPKIQASGYKTRQIIGIAPQEKKMTLYLGNLGLRKLFKIWITILGGSMRTSSSSRLTSL
jgi:hypothetical protein